MRFRTVCGLGLAALLSLFVCPADAMDRVEFSPFTGQGYILRYYSGSKKLWTARAAAPVALTVPPRRQVLFSAWDPRAGRGHRPLTLMNYRGRVVWRNFRAQGKLGDFGEFMGGGNAVFAQEQGPAFGMGYETDVEGWPLYLRECKTRLIDLKSGRTRWTSNLGAAGWPLWTNGRVFFALKWDLSKAAVRRYEHSGLKIPVWLEERSVGSRRVLWRKRLAGMPSFDVSVSAVRGRRVKVSFAGGESSFDECRFLNVVKGKFDVMAPLVRGSALKEAEMPVMVRGVVGRQRARRMNE